MNIKPGSSSNLAFRPSSSTPKASPSQMGDQCPLMGALQGDCDAPPKRTLSSSSNSSEEYIRDMLHQLVTTATKPKTIRRKKKPVMKSGMMHLADVIPNFEITEQVFQSLLFSEKLLVSKFEVYGKAPSPVGALVLDIQGARGSGPRKNFLMQKFLVHLSSQLQHVGYNGGSRITAWVDRDLQTIEERRKEFLKLDEELDTQTLYINSQENFYYLRHDSKEDIYYSKDRAKNLICEGSNFILMRYLAVTRFVGRFEVSTVYIDGSICRNIYECTGPSSGLVNNQKVDVCKVYRTVMEQCGLIHRTVTVLTLGGRLLKQEWQSCDYILQINPLVDVTLKPLAHERIPLEEKIFDDLELLSLYLDAKTRSKKMIENYMEDYPEIKEMLADYVQAILQLKPHDVFEFTAQYFLSFTPALLPLSEYFEPPVCENEDTDDYYL